MKTLNQGQEISKFRKGVFDDGEFKTPFIFLFLILGGLIIGLILYIVQIYSFSNFNITPTENVKDFLFYFDCIISFLGLFLYYITRPSKGKNPSVCFFPNYLLVRNEGGEVEVPFKMVKRFRLLENEKKVVVEYKDEYMICVKLGDKGEYHQYFVYENPRTPEDLVLPGPDSIKFPQDKVKGLDVWGKGEFSFWLIGNSKKINLSIVDELNQIIHQHSE
jgi:hypothetical protein